MKIGMRMEPSELFPLFKWLVVMYDFMLGKINRKINWIGFFRKLIWVVKTSLPNAGNAGSIPGQGAKTLYASWAKKKKNPKT